MTFNIFISYSTKDIETAKRQQNYFSQIQGTRVFLSESSLILGQLSDVFINEIKKCDLFIVLYSKNSQNSTYVQQEIGVAKGNGKLVIPVLLDAEAKPDAMLQGISYLSIYDEEKRNTQMPRLYQYITQETQKKATGETLLFLGALYTLYSLSRHR
ncbi:MAG: toll/interleukin-1 receptor domain-containing protein [Candidatus Diapherotrites archaeon]|uniref:Toll/interleukin-1 receptor domain-containing protein n=1 Tax=Candidatus Iainarchaeum sp. TaxID=3101447 RepID=A0A8T4LE31_9ARCH|nr:toll/interleukin-1 receptor domain-containing protein [Candidatus Diapherotrites archaeon]